MSKSYRAHLADTLAEGIPDEFLELLDRLGGVPPCSPVPAERGEGSGKATEGGDIRH